MFARRVVGLQLGTIVYDGPPEDLTPEVLTDIYGEEDWEATIEAVKNDDEVSDDQGVDADSKITKLKPVS